MNAFLGEQQTYSNLQLDLIHLILSPEVNGHLRNEMHLK